MSKRGDIEYISDIKEAAKRIESYLKGFSYQKLRKNVKTQDAVL